MVSNRHPMHQSSKNPSSERNEKEMLRALADLNKAILEEQYRKLMLVSQPAVKVYEWFYLN